MSEFDTHTGCACLHYNAVCLKYLAKYLACLCLACKPHKCPASVQAIAAILHSRARYMNADIKLLSLIVLNDPNAKAWGLSAKARTAARASVVVKVVSVGEVR